MAPQGKARVVIQLASVVSTLSTFLDRPDGDDFDEDFELQFSAVAQKAERLLDGIAKPKLGRGGGGPGVRAPNLKMPSQMYYDSYVRLPEQFQGLCGYSPKEFEDLHARAATGRLSSDQGLARKLIARLSFRRSQ